MSSLFARVVRKAQEALDICSLELAAADGGQLPAFSAGSYIDVHLPRGLVRQYSLFNCPSERHRYLIAVLRERHSRGGSVAIHDRIAVGDVLEISAPKNHFALVPAPQSLLFAGGIGITPILCMAERLAQTSASFSLHYCARSRDRMAFVRRIESASYGSCVQMHFDDGPERQKLDLSAVLDAAQPGAQVYVCGPAAFMECVLSAARERGWSEDRLHREYFTAAPAVSGGDSPFEVKIASTGRWITVPPDRSVVDVLAEAGVQIPVSCAQGICGTCVTRVLEGSIEHRDLYLTGDEKARNDRFTPCVSRAAGKYLVLDL